MTDAEKAALKWLDKVIDGNRGAWGVNDERTRAPCAIKAMLAAPRLPAEPTKEAIKAMYEGYWTWDGSYRALYAHLTKPNTKTVEVWRVECAQFMPSFPKWYPIVCTYDTEQEARDIAVEYEKAGVWRFIRVTGPHLQEVPNG
jgi:hypothetical protein